MSNSRKYHIGIIGTGFIARGLIYTLDYHPQLVVNRVLTRRPIKTIKNLPLEKKKLTHDIEKIVRTSDLVVECSGDAIHGTEMAEPILKAGIPVVTMNPELQITSGTILSQMGTFIEAEGDHPGTLAVLDKEVKNMGFKPIVYGSIKKGYLDLKPTLEEMEYWAKEMGITLSQVTALSDGSKVQIEQALVANGLGATIASRGLSCIECKNYEEGTNRLGEIADKVGEPISDYLLSPGLSDGVFIVAKHHREQAPYLKYLRLGDGPNYVIVKPYHLCHLEIAKTINNVLIGNTEYNFSNGQKPTIQVMAIAKGRIKSGEFIERGLGGFDVRGEAVKIRELPEAVPITLMHKVRFVKKVEEGQIIKFDDVELPKTRALEMWQEVLKKVSVGTEDKTKYRRGKRKNGETLSTPRQLIQEKLASIRPFARLKPISLLEYLKRL